MNQELFAIDQVRGCFPQLTTVVNDKNLVYLDSGATALKPTSVVDVLQKYYQLEAANVHRGVHFLSEKNTALYESARDAVQSFIGATLREEVLFTKGTTESVNLVAYSYGRSFIKSGDEILLCAMEHHANLVPWQILCEQTGAVLKIIPLLPHGEIDLSGYQNLLSSNTKIVAVTHISNVLGVKNPVTHMAKLAHEAGAVILVDAAQSVAHQQINVNTWDADFVAFSLHKLFGPTGVGVLWGRHKLLQGMPPFLAGGDMIRHVSFAKTTYNDLPHKFEAGTPAIASVLGVTPAIQFAKKWFGPLQVAHEEQLMHRLLEGLSVLKSVKLLGNGFKRHGLVSLNVEGCHTQDLAMILDQMGIAVRTGHHCAQPLHEWFGVKTSLRISMALYNTVAEVDYFLECLAKAIRMLK